MFTLLFISALVYCVRLTFFIVGQARRTDVSSLGIELPMVSVIVPARNEERNLERCLQALEESTYPRNRYEIIVVNDRSEDATESVLNSLVARYTNIKPLHRRDTEDHPNLKGKPGAIQHGIDHANGSLYLLTDADCKVHPQWIESLVAPFHDPLVSLVCGFTIIRLQRSFDILQDIEWLYTQTMARAGIQNGVPLGCFGNNMAIRASTYHELGGYESIPFSITEDLAILQAISSAGKTVHYLCVEQATVETLPCETLGEYFSQKHRWVRGGMALGTKALAFVVSGALYWIGLVASLLTHEWNWAAGFLTLRIAGDGLLITTSAARLRRWRVLPAVAPAIVILLLLELLLPFMTLSKRIVWKNQIFRQ